jgi:quinol monooxygenase YgiN
MRTTLLIRHRIGDFDAWLRIYRGFAEAQAAGGVRSQMALRAADDPDDVVVIHTFNSREAAEAYLGDAALKAAMAEATVDDDTVTVEFFEEVVPVTA